MGRMPGSKNKVKKVNTKSDVPSVLVDKGNIQLVEHHFYTIKLTDPPQSFVEGAFETKPYATLREALEVFFLCLDDADKKPG